MLGFTKFSHDISSTSLLETPPSFEEEMHHSMKEAWRGWSTKKLQVEVWVLPPWRIRPRERASGGEGNSAKGEELCIRV